MAFEYSQHGRYGQPFDSSRCKASVPDGGRSVGSHQCSRKPWKDGWCKQHHPDSEAARRKASREKYERQQYNSPWAQLRRAGEKIETLTMERDGLVETLQDTLESLNGMEVESSINQGVLNVVVNRLRGIGVVVKVEREQ